MGLVGPRLLLAAALAIGKLAVADAFEARRAGRKGHRQRVSKACSTKPVPSADHARRPRRRDGRSAVVLRRSCAKLGGRRIGAPGGGHRPAPEVTRVTSKPRAVAAPRGEGGCQRSTPLKAAVVGRKGSCSNFSDLRERPVGLGLSVPPLTEYNAF